MPPARTPGGCLLRVALVIALLTGLVVLIGTIFDQGDGASQPVRGFVAGPAENFQLADVNYFEQQHAFVVRLQDGAFIALYDRSPRRQELQGGTDCRVFYDETAAIGTLEQLPGMRGALVEDCDEARTVWRVDGAFAFGAGYEGVPLDRFATRVDRDGRLIVDTRSRTCTRSRGAPGLGPFVEQRCGKAD